MLAALATTDGKVVNSHFGKCPAFSIVEIDDDTWNWRFLERRESPPACRAGEHDPVSFGATVQALRDCGVVFVSRVGPYGRSALERHGLQVLELTGPVDQVLEGYIVYLKRKAAHSSQDNLSTGPTQTESAASIFSEGNDLA